MATPIRFRRRTIVKLPAVEWQFEARHISFFHGLQSMQFGRHICQMRLIRVWLADHWHDVRFVDRNGKRMLCVRKSIFPVCRFAA